MNAEKARRTLPCDKIHSQRKEVTKIPPFSTEATSGWANREVGVYAEYGCMRTIELRRYAKFQVHIFKTDSGKKARRGAGL